MYIKIIPLSLLWGALAGITHVFLGTLQQSPMLPAHYFFRLLLRYSILFGFAVTLVKILHGSVGFFAIGFGITTLAFLVHTVRN